MCVTIYSTKIFLRQIYLERILASEELPTLAFKSYDVEPKSRLIIFKETVQLPVSQSFQFRYLHERANMLSLAIWDSSEARGRNLLSGTAVMQVALAVTGGPKACWDF